MTPAGAQALRSGGPPDALALSDWAEVVAHWREGREPACGWLERLDRDGRIAWRARAAAPVVVATGRGGGVWSSPDAAAPTAASISEGYEPRAWAREVDRDRWEWVDCTSGRSLGPVGPTEAVRLEVTARAAALAPALSTMGEGEITAMVRRVLGGAVGAIDDLL